MPIGNIRNFTAPFCRTRTHRWLSPVIIGLSILSCLAIGNIGCGDEKSTAPEIQHPQDFHPTSASSWAAAMEIETGTTLAELTEGLVDGGAEVYTNHHMTEYAVCNYTYTGTGTLSGGSMGLWIFKMSSANDALALYDDPQIVPGSGIEELDELGVVGRRTKALFTTKVEFIRNEFYIKVTFDRVSTEADLELELLTSSIDQEIKG